MLKKLSLLVIIIPVSVSIACAQRADNFGQTTITKWKYGKKAAISLTYDDNTINQFQIALPLMKKFGFPATFFVITGIVPGSEYKPEFTGSPINQIIRETAKTSTNKHNFFERASALRFLGYTDTYHYFMRVGSQFEGGHIQKAYDLIDEAYKKVRDGELKSIDDSVAVRHGVLKNGQATYPQHKDVAEVTWDQLKKYQSQGYEIGSHSISHPYLSILDSVNIMYELKKSKEELRKHLGPQATFSAELPFGIGNNRAINYGLNIYSALRNKIPEPYLAEINRGDNHDPTRFHKDYIQWQRGPLTDTPMKEMKSWIKTSLTKDNVWLVLVFHGIAGIGWEPLSKNKLQKYFSFIKDNEQNIWVDTFKNVTKYMRERENANVDVQKRETSIIVNLSHSLKKSLYNLPLTLKTYVPAGWSSVKVQQGHDEQMARVQQDKQGHYILYQIKPNDEAATLTKS